MSPDPHSPADPPTPPSAHQGTDASVSSTDRHLCSAPGTGGQRPAAVPVTGRVWLTSQQPPRTQRGRRYTRESVVHPAKMLPAIAAHAIATLSCPG